MRRRDLLAGLAFAVTGVEGEEPDHSSLYIPKAHRVEDRAFLHDFMDEFSFVDLVTTTPTLRITHIPILLDRSAGTLGTLYGHIARNNVQIQAIESGQNAVVMFRGPHAYISPSWYAKAEGVPTWNFATVHATGKLNQISDKKTLHGVLGRLIAKFEDRYGSGTDAYDFSKLPESYVYGMMGGIMGFSLQIDNLEGKFKLGQERKEADRAGMLKHLEAAKKERSMRDFTAAFYERFSSTKPAG